jgi:VRR-NUC domain
MRWTKEQLSIHNRRTNAAPVTVEKDLHADIIAELKALRIYFVHSRMDKAHTNGIGCPDFILALQNEDGTPRTVWIEVKTAKGKLTREQSGVAMLLKIANHEHHVIRSLKEFLEIL